MLNKLNNTSFKGVLTLKNCFVFCKSDEGIQYDPSDISAKNVDTRDIVDIQYNEDGAYTSISTLRDSILKEYRIPKSYAPLSEILSAYHIAEKDDLIRIIF